MLSSLCIDDVLSLKVVSSAAQVISDTMTVKSVFAHLLKVFIFLLFSRNPYFRGLSGCCKMLFIICSQCRRPWRVWPGKTCNVKNTSIKCMCIQMVINVYCVFFKTGQQLKIHTISRKSQTFNRDITFLRFAVHLQFLII